MTIKNNTKLATHTILLTPEENSYIFVEGCKRVESCFILGRILINCVLIFTVSTTLVWVALKKSNFLIEFHII